MCVLLFAYEVFASRRRYTFPTPADPDDPWRSIFDDLHDWFSGPRVSMLLAGTGVSLIALGAFHSSGQMVRSTYVCLSPLDSRGWTDLLQVIGLLLDAIITVQLWRVLAWTRTTAARLQTLGVLFLSSSLIIGTVYVATTLFGGASRPSFFLEAPFSITILVDGAFFAAFVFCASTWLCATSPIIPSTTLTVLGGLWASILNASAYGDWTHFYSSSVATPAWAIAGGSILFAFCHGVRVVFYIKRAVFIAALVGMSLAISFRVSRTPTPSYPRHPISDLVFKAQIAHDHWVKEATVSSNVRAATHIYQKRHNGRAPPPKFDEWYKFAQGAAVIDTFEQIDNDLAPFWNYPPDVLRQRAEAVASAPGVFTVTIRNGDVSYSDGGSEEDKRGLQQLSDAVRKFSKHLPDMTIPINLHASPRMLPVWEDAYGQSYAGRGESHSKRSEASGQLDTRETGFESEALRLQGGPSPFRFRDMVVNACPPTSQGRLKTQWDFAEMCYECIDGHSKHEFLVKWDVSTQMCEQPDLLHLHEMLLSSPETEPIREMGPLFSFSKTDAFSDILIPLPGPTLTGYQSDIKWEFKRRYDSLFWRGTVGPKDSEGQVLRASPKYRLLHLLMHPSSHDEVIILLPGHGRDVNEFGYKKVPAPAANGMLSFDVGLTGLEHCSGPHCDIIKQAFDPKDENQEAHEYRYVLLVDEQKPEPEKLMRALRSKSMPLVSTVFRSWYTERLRPYLHMVPVDMRFHALHTTYLYFSEAANQVRFNRVDTGPGQGAKRDDGEWIAMQGQKWAEEALGEKDMEVYLFRLFLEWGRLIDDRRDEAGFRVE